MTVSLFASVGSFGCGDDETSGDSSSSSSVDTSVNGPVATGVIEDPEDHYVEGTLHDVNVDFENPVSDFVKDGKTDYQIVLGSKDPSRGAGFMSNQITSASGAKINTVSRESVQTIDENTQYILMDCIDDYEELGYEMPSFDELGTNGFQIRTVGKNVFINAHEEGGYNLASVLFLRYVLGYDMIAEDTVVFENKGEKMPEMDVTERPDYDFRNDGGSATETEIFGMGYTMGQWMLYYQGKEGGGDAGSMHGWNSFISKKEAQANPDWASPDATQNQPCYYARGNKERYKQMLDHCIERTKEILTEAWEYIKSDNITLMGQSDTGIISGVEVCSCQACQASFNYYGGTTAGAWMSFCNRIAVNVDEWLETEEAIAIFGKKRVIRYLQLVYHSQAAPPAQKDADGNYIMVDGKGVPMKEMWFNEDGSMEEWPEELAYGVTDELLYYADHVDTIWAPSRADFTHSFYEPENQGFKTMAELWSGFRKEGDDSARFHVWLYSQNFRNYMYPQNTFDSDFESFRFHKGLSVSTGYSQHAGGNENNPGFLALRLYLHSKMLFDVNSNYTYYLEKFFKHYYGVVSDEMFDYFNDVMTYRRIIEETLNVSGSTQADVLGNAEYWPQGMLQQWWNTLEGLLVVVENEYRATDYDKYIVIRDHVLTETLFPRFALCNTYGDYYAESELKAMRQSFLDDFYALGNVYYKEGHPMTEISAEWGL